jgi:PAS domain S-box-containing protein
VKSTRDASASLADSGSPVPLESVLCTEELNRRPTRPPDYETENRTLVSLAEALAESPRTILQTLADKILEVFQAGSAGISLLTKDDGGKRFYWPAVSGVWKPHIGGGTPRNFSPCGDVLDRNAPLMFRRLDRRYTYFLDAGPPVEEALLVPFYLEGKAIGTIWMVVHDGARKFDAEDMRQLSSLGRFASSAYQAVAFSDALQQKDETLRQNHTQLAHSLINLRQANLQAQDSRRAALNLMEDAIRARQAMESLNVELLESEERYRTLFESAPMAVFVCDHAGVIQHYNARAVELWGREPVRGVERYCGSLKLWLPDGTLLPHEKSPIVEVLRTGIPVRGVEVFIERPDGSRLPVLVNFSPLKDPSGEITGAIASCTDISVRKRAEEALREAQALLTDRAALLEQTVQERTAKLQETIGELEHFSYTITHDMRAPLRAMQGFGGILLNESGDHLTPKSADYLRRITDAAQRMDALIRDALQYTKILRGEITLSSVEPGPLLSGIVESYPTLQPAHVDIRVVEPLPAVIANEASLIQCFSNLLGNAVKFVAPGVKPQVRVWAEVIEPPAHLHTPAAPHALNVRFWFEDNGIGIAPECQPRIFDMFQQLDHSFEGTGIGLALVRKSAERMGGQVGLESELGKGSRFWLQLPKA